MKQIGAEKMQTTPTDKIYVISLPRTGTKSLCKMLEVLGYKVKHLPSVFYDKFVKEDYQVFADTPVYAPSFVKLRSFEPNAKFIYIDRDATSWINSIESINLHKGYEVLMNIKLAEQLNQVRIQDMQCLGEVFGYHKQYEKSRFINCFYNHRYQLENILDNKLFAYRFQDGWAPLCNYLNVDIPNLEIPHLNKNTISEKF